MALKFIYIYICMYIYIYVCIYIERDIDIYKYIINRPTLIAFSLNLIVTQMKNKHFFVSRCLTI